MRRRIEASAAVRAEVDSVLGLVRDPVEVLGRRGPSSGDYLREMSAELHDGTTIRQEVVVTLGLPDESDIGFRCTLAWRPTGRERLVPAFDGVMKAHPDLSGGTVLRVSGIYHPPLGPLGAVADTLVMQRVARRTLADFVQQLGAAIDAAVDGRRGGAWAAVAPRPDDARPTASEQWLG
jgi:hypothetical protein